MTTVRSFDFWDTLVTRLVMRPSQVFDLVELISGEVGFAQARIEAERHSRVGVNETNLSRIYDRLNYKEDTKERLMNMERELEFNLCSPIGTNVLQLSPNDIVISDMYLSSADLIKIAENCGVILSQEMLFVSNEYGVTKHHGHFFDQVLASFNIASHIGDNLHGDVKMPKSRGILAEHFLECNPNQLEKRWDRKLGEDKYMAGVLRSARLSCPSPVLFKKKQWEIYSQIIAPVLYAFIEWIFEDCSKRGIQDIFFLARDGQILHRVATAICQKRNLPFNCQYVYASRQALHLPGYVSIDQAETWILDNTIHLSLRTISDRTGVSIENVIRIASPWLAVNPDANLGVEHRALMREVIRSSEFIQAIESASMKAFATASKYYSGVGLCSLSVGQDKAIVDVGWNGRIQQSLENLVYKCGGSPESLHGYYLAISENCINQNGKRLHGYLSDPYVSNNFNSWVDCYRGMIELFLAADHPSVIGFCFDETLKHPQLVFGAELTSLQVDQIHFRQEAIMSLVNALLKFEGAVGFRMGYEKKDIVEQLHRLLTSPTRLEAESFGRDFFSEQQVESQYMPMVKKIRLSDLLSNKKAYRWGGWNEGSFALSGILWTYKLKTLLSNIWKAFTWRT